MSKVKNKEKFTLTDLTLFDVKEEDGRKMVAIYRNQMVGKFKMKDGECYIDACMRWLESDWSEFKDHMARTPDDSNRVSQIKLSDIPVIPDEILNTLDKPKRGRGRPRKSK